MNYKVIFKGIDDYEIIEGVTAIAVDTDTNIVEFQGNQEENEILAIFNKSDIIGLIKVEVVIHQ